MSWTNVGSGCVFFFPAKDGIRYWSVTGVQTCALPIYPDAVAEMESRAADIADQKAAELVWLLEHPPLYTSGTSGKDADLLDPRFPLFTTGRGGQIGRASCRERREV